MGVVCLWRMVKWYLVRRGGLLYGLGVSGSESLFLFFCYMNGHYPCLLLHSISSVNIAIACLQMEKYTF